MARGAACAAVVAAWLLVAARASELHAPGVLVARCEGGPVALGGGAGTWAVTSLSATVEVGIPSDADVTHHEPTGPGTARPTFARNGVTTLAVNATVTDGGNAPAAGTTLPAHIHVGACSSGADPGVHYAFPDSTQETLAELEFGGTTTVALSTSAYNHTAVPDKMRSLVVHAPDNTKIACCPLVPPRPALPAEWSVAVEANIANKGYSITQYETHSKENDAVRVAHRYHAMSVVDITRVAEDRTVRLYKNSTYPQGFCEERPMSRFEKSTFDRQQTGRLSSTADFFGLTGDESYHGTDCADCVVRGVTCEKWTHAITFARTGFSASYNVSYYFAAMDWDWPMDEEPFRKLVRVQLDGYHVTGGTQSPVAHTYEYIDFHSREIPSSTFDPCAVYPDGETSACGCVPGSRQDDNDDDDDDMSRGSDEEDYESDGDGKVGDLDAGAFAGLVVALVVVVGGGAAAVVYFRRRAASSAAQHQQFTDDATSGGASL